MGNEKKSNFWIWFIIIILILYFYSSWREEWEEKNCNLTFYTYTYNDGCISACSVKCSNEGFLYVDSSYFEPFLSYEEMINPLLYKRCECNCGGCRER